MKNIYYVVQKQLNDVDGFEETNGWKDISILEVKNEKINILSVLEIHNTDDSKLAVMGWLDENLGKDGDSIELIQI